MAARYRHSDSVAVSKWFAVRLTVAYWDADTNSNRNTNADADADSYTNSDRYTNTVADRNADAESVTVANAACMSKR